MRIYLSLALLFVSPIILGSDSEKPDPFSVCEAYFKRSNYHKAAFSYEQVFEHVGLCPTRATEEQQRRAHINYGETLMALGKYKKGGEEFEHRLENTAMGRIPLTKAWDGSDPKGKTILVRVEHGLGDTFFAMRNAKMLHELGAKVVMRAQGFMKPILERQSYIDKVVTNNDQEQEAAFDHDIYTLSLPRFVSKHGLKGVETHADIAYSQGYIEPRADRVAYWQQELSKDGAKKRIAIVWRASKNVAGEVRSLQRDVPLAMLVTALSKDGVALYSLQGGGHYPIDKQEYEKRKNKGTLGDLDELDVIDNPASIKTFDATFDKTCGSFEDTAAVMCAVDQVVSVDTSTGMLAGALGKAVKDFRLLLPAESDWRHGEGKPTTSPYFDNATLHWQEKQGDWSKPMSELSQN